MTPLAVRGSSRRIRARLAALKAVETARALLVYVSRGNEVATHRFIYAMLVLGKRVAVPRVVDPAHMEAVEITRWSRWRVDEFGLCSPADSLPFPDRLDVCVVPGLAFSPRGDRLGFGKGHWDRFLAANLIPCTIGLCHDWQVHDDLPREATDRPADFVLTEERLLDCGTASSLPAAPKSA